MKGRLRAGALLLFSMICATWSCAQSPELTRELVAQTGHSEWILAIAYSADGKLLASADHSGKIVLWSTEKGDQLRSWKAHASRVTSLAFGPGDVTLISSGWDGAVRSWDPKNGKNKGAIPAAHGGDAIDTLAVNLERNLLVTSSNTPSKDNSVKIWDISADTIGNPRPLGHDHGGISAVAFSNDGKQLVTGGHDHTVKLWDVDSGTLIHTFDYALPAEVKSVAFSPDGQWIAGAGGGFAGHTQVVIWDRETYQDYMFPTNDEWISSLAFSLDGQWLVAGTSASGESLHLWNLKTNPIEERTLSTLRHAEVHAVVFSPDGQWLAYAGTDNAVNIRDARHWDERPVSLQGHVRPITAIALSPDGHTLASGSLISRDINTGNYRNAGDLKLWDLSGQTNLRQLSGFYGPVDALVFSPMGDQLASAHGGGEIRLWNAGTGKETVKTVPPQIILWNTTNSEVIGASPLPKVQNTAGCLAMSKDGRWLASGGDDRLVAIWDAQTLTLAKTLTPQVDIIRSLAFSPLNNLLAVATRSDMSIHLWNISTGQIEQTVGRDDETGHSVRSLAFSPDGNLLASGTTDGRIQLWDVNNPAEPIKTWRTFVGQGDEDTGNVDHTVNTIVFFPNGKRLAAGSQDHTISIWDVESKSEQPTLLRLPGHTDAVKTLAVRPAAVVGDNIVVNDAMLFSGSPDAQINLWDAAGPNTGEKDRALASLVPLDDSSWAVIGSEGRFDADNLWEIPSLRWVVSDRPFKPLPPEIFMRNYYEPGLLQRLLAREDLERLPSLASLNRVQPLVEVEKVEWQNAAIGLARVTVKVRGNQDTFPGKNGIVWTGVYDLRFFRDKQLVGWEPKSSVDWQPQAPQGSELYKRNWRKQTKVLLDRDGSKSFSFSVQVPRRADLKQVTFSAYAFNEDQVKSATANRTLDVAAGLKSRVGKAYVITMGVNAYQRQGWDLHFAASDAKRVQEALSKRLRGYEVVPVTMISDCRTAGCPEDGDRNIGEDHATKAALHAVLEKLAGHDLSKQLQANLPPGAEKVEKAEPDDLVMISISSHGYTDKEGTFYMVPSDSGDTEGKQITPALTKKWVSSDELSAWLRDVDAGDLVMIMDTCHSAATVEEPGFKPGPMGSRGLGQLAYDKGMRILAASQADDVALESEKLGKGQGLLTYALVVNGLEEGQAVGPDGKGEITMDSWLQYGAKRVPALYRDVLEGKVRVIEAETRETIPDEHLPGGSSSLNKPNAFQQPVLFDFAKGRSEVILAVLARRSP